MCVYIYIYIYIYIYSGGLKSFKPDFEKRARTKHFYSGKTQPLLAKLI